MTTALRGSGLCGERARAAGTAESASSEGVPFVDVRFGVQMNLLARNLKLTVTQRAMKFGFGRRGDSRTGTTGRGGGL